MREKEQAELYFNSLIHTHNDQKISSFPDGAYAHLCISFTKSQQRQWNASLQGLLYVERPSWAVSRGKNAQKKAHHAWLTI